MKDSFCARVCDPFGRDGTAYSMRLLISRAVEIERAMIECEDTARQ